MEIAMFHALWHSNNLLNKCIIYIVYMKTADTITGQEFASLKLDLQISAFWNPFGTSTIF